MATQTQALTAEEIETYRRNGVVCLRGVPGLRYDDEEKAQA